MSHPEITSEKRQKIEDLARDIIIELEGREDVFECGYDHEDCLEYFTGEFSDVAQSVIEQFLLRQVGKGLL